MNALLLTAHILNDYGESMPIAFALINEEDIDSVRAFYEALRDLRPAAFSKIQILISDIAPAYYSAWKKHIRTKIKHLACAWHLDRALNTNIKDNQIIAAIGGLRLTSDESIFWSLLGSFELKYGDSSEGKYFLKYYGKILTKRLFNRIKSDVMKSL